jgi:hypothetical protein
VQYLKATPDMRLFRAPEPYSAVFEMVRTNLFRVMPPKVLGLGTYTRYLLAESESEETIDDLAWFHREVRSSVRLAEF